MNTKRIGVQRHAARTGAIKGAWESDAFACDFGQRCRRQYLLYYQAFSCSPFAHTYADFAHTYAEQALLRVRGRAMHLRAGLDGEDAGNTCRIIKSSPSKDVRKGALPRVPLIAPVRQRKNPLEKVRQYVIIIL